MAGIPIANMGDLIGLTLNRTPKKIAGTLDRTAFAAAKFFFLDAKEPLPGGENYETQLRIRDSASARWVNPRQKVQTNTEDLTVQLTTPAAFYLDTYDFNEEEDRLNAGGDRIVALIDVRRDATYAGIYKMIDDTCVLAPTSASGSASQPNEIRGIAYHLPFLQAGVNDPIGSFGAYTIRYRDGTTGTTWQGVDASDVLNARARAYGATYSGEMNPATLRTMREAMTRCDFMSLPDVPDRSINPGRPEWVLAMGHTLANQYEDMMNHASDDLESDLGRFKGGRFRGAPVLRVPALDGLTYSPFYGLNRKKLFGVVWQNDWMKETKPTNSREQLTTWTVGVKGTCNMHCENRREAGFCIHTVTA